MDKYCSLLLAIICGIFLAYLRTLYWMVGSWIMNPYYSHGLLVLAISMYLLYKVKKNNKNILKEGEGSIVGLIILSFALMVHTLSYIYDYYWISAISFPFALFGCVYFINTHAAKKVAFPIFFILFAVPYPIYGLANRLEVFSALLASKLLNMIGVNTTLNGAEIITAKNTFVVGAPCSGIRSLLALATVSVFYTHIARDRLLLRTAILILSAPLAIFTNVLRIISTIISAEYIGLKFSMTYIHPLSDLIFFIFAVLIIIKLEKLLRRVVT